MRKEALIGLSVLLVAVSGSATVLDSFGVVSGEASVESPTFYADSGDSLILNPPEDASGNHQSLANGANFVFGNSKEWYPMNVDFAVEARFEDEPSQGVTQTEVIARFGGDQNNCETRFNVSYAGDGDPEYDVYDGDIENCKINSPPNNDLSLNFEDAEGESGAYIKYDGDTKVEVNAQ